MENISCLSHISLGTNRFPEAVAFYDTVLATLGYQKLADYPNAVAYGKIYPEFWLQLPYDGQTATVGNGTHIAFLATNPAAVDRFYQTALAAGARCDGPAGPRPLYGDGYYGCFVRDLDGHKIEATFYSGT